MAIAEQELIEPATKLPRDAKPSELVRGWPEDRWEQGSLRQPAEDGAIGYCAIGILSYLGGYCGIWSTDRCRAFVAKIYGVGWSELGRVIAANDDSGKDAAADVLEAAGF